MIRGPRSPRSGIDPRGKAKVKQNTRTADWYLVASGTWQGRTSTRERKQTVVHSLFA